MRQWLGGAYPEALLATPLFAFDALLAASTTSLSGRALIASAITCAGAGLTGWRPWLGMGVTAFGLVMQLSLPPQEVAMGILACLIPVLSAVSRRQWRMAGVALAIAVAAATTYTLVDEGPSEGAILTLAAWAIMLAIAGGLGAALGTARHTGGLALEQREREQRRQIAADLHDNVAHDLATVAMRVEEVRLKDSVEPGDLDFIADAVRRSSRYLREMMAMLHLPAGEAAPLQDLGAALTACADDLTRHGFRVSQQSEADPAAIPVVSGDTLAKVARESTNNIIRHGDPAEPCSLLLVQSEGSWELVVSNAVAPGRRRGSGLGLSGMRQRLESIGGGFKVVEAPGLWAIRATVPSR